MPNLLLLVIAGACLVDGITRAEQPENRSEPAPPSTHRSGVELCCIRLSRLLVVSTLGQYIEIQTPIDNVVLGTDVHGSAVLKGTLTVDLVPDRRAAVLLLFLEGGTTSQTVGHNGPAIIYSTGTTRFRCTKRIEFGTDSGLRHQVAEINARTRLETSAIRSVRGGLCGNLIHCIAKRRVRRQHCAARTIAAANARARISRSFDAYVDERAKAVNEVLRSVEPLIREKREVLDRQWFLSSTRDWVCAVLLSSNEDFGTPESPDIKPWESSDMNGPDLLVDIWLRASWTAIDPEELEGTLSAAARAAKALATQVRLRAANPLGEMEDGDAPWTVDVQDRGDWKRIVLTTTSQPLIDPRTTRRSQ